MSDQKKPKRRDFLFTASYALGAVGVGASSLALNRSNEPRQICKSLSKHRS